MAKVYQASGKRKKAIARATLTQEGTGIIRINKIPVEMLTPMMARWRMKELLLLIKDDKLNTVNINIDAGRAFTALTKDLWGQLNKAVI